MVKEREQLAEAILNHALEIICLLTVEDFIVVQRPIDGTRCAFSIRATENNRNMRDSSSGCPELLFTLLGMEDKSQKMIAELANKIVWLLTKEKPVKCDDVAVYLSKDEWEYLEGHGVRYKNNQETCTIEAPTAPVQQSTEKGHPMKCFVKVEPEEVPHNVTEQPTAPAQQRTERNDPMKCRVKEEPEDLSHHVTEPPTAPVQLITEKSYPVKCRIKEEPEEEPYHVTDGTSGLPSSEFMPGSSGRKPFLPTLIVHIPIMEDQPPSAFSYISSCDIKPEPDGSSSEDTMDSVDSDETSGLPSSEIIPGSSGRKPFLPTLNVHVPLMEDKTASGFNYISSYDIKQEPDGESSEDTMDSADSDPPESPPSPDGEHVYSIIEHIKEEPEESRDSCVSEDEISPGGTYTDEEYTPPITDCKRARTRKSRSGKTLLPCEVCGKLLASKSTLEKHLQIHTGQRPFACNECDKKFSCKNHLAAHKRSHAGERPYACNQCGRKFLKHQHLVLHQVVHTGEKPYSCPVCGKGFTRQSSVVKHSGMHAEKKPYVCNDCGKSYCQYASLVVHQRLHSGEKPFVCKHCEKAFACKATMLKHQSGHVGDKLFPCPQCDKCFIDNSSLSKHKRRVHGKGSKPTSSLGVVSV